jgi:hypothetical protein
VKITRKFRALARRFGVSETLVRGPRRSSYPFISGDTFRTFADFIVESEKQQSRLILENTLNKKRHKIIFVSADFSEFFLSALPSELAKDLTVLIHNGDLIPVDVIYEHSPRFRKLFVVNWLGDPGIAEPLPIGLENSWHGVNGNIRRFADGLPDRRSKLVGATRPLHVLLAFNVGTNLSQRLAAVQAFDLSNIKDSTLVSLSVSEYHRRLRTTQFIVSPPGNGHDCHRTWEAMYCGAVPIVLADHWPFSHISLPVIVSKTWADVVTVLDQPTSDLYRRYSTIDTPELFAESYFEKIRESQRR